MNNSNSNKGVLNSTSYEYSKQSDISYSPDDNLGFLVPVRNYEADLTISGNRFGLSSIGDLSDYTMSDDLKIDTSLSIVSNSTTAWQSLGFIDVPSDLMSKSLYSDIKFDVNTQTNLNDVQLAISICGKNGTRSQSSYYIIKLFGSSFGSGVGGLDFRVTSITPSLIQISELTSEKAPTSYPGSSQKRILAGNFASGVRVVFLIKYPNASGGNSLRAANSSISFKAKSRNMVDLTLNRVHPARAPFVDSDVWKSRLPSWTLAYSEVVSANPGTTGDSSTGTLNASGTAGSDILTVYSTAGVSIGMWPMIGVQGKVQGSSAFDTMRPHFPNANDTYNAFGAGTTVISVLNGTQVQLSQPLKSNVSLRGQIWSGGEAMNCVAFYRSPETACVRYGQGSNSLTISPFTGVQKSNTAATAARSCVAVVRSKSSDPIVNFRVTSINANNAWLHDFSSSFVTQFFESIDGATFQIRIPSYLNQSYLENGAQNPDKNLCIISECGKYSIEMIGVNLNVNPATATRAVAVDLTRNSYPTLDQYDLGPLSNGTRAYGGPLIGGMIRKWEMDLCYDTGYIQQDIERAMNAINHPISILIGNAQGKSNNYCVDPTIQANKTTYKSYRSINSVHYPSIASGGTGYKIGDVLYISGGTYTTPMTCVVTGVSSGVVTSVSVQRTGQYKTIPSDASALSTTTSGSGSGCVLNALSIPSAPDQTTSSIAFQDINSQGRVIQYPAATADNGYASTYAGVIPMGAMFTIPKSLDLVSIWTARRTSSPTALYSSYELLAILSAIQKYGAIVTDISGSFQQIIVVDDEVAYSSSYANIHGDTGSSTYPNLELIKRLLVYVENPSYLNREDSNSNRRNRLLSLV